MQIVHNLIIFARAGWFYVKAILCFSISIFMQQKKSFYTMDESFDLIYYNTSKTTQIKLQVFITEIDFMSIKPNK